MSTDPMQQTPSAPPGAPPAAPLTTQPAAGPGEIPSTPEERQMAMLGHLVGGLLPGFGWIVPLIIWNMKKDSPYVEDQAKEAANFLINAAMGFVLCVILIQIPYISVIGIILTLAIVLGTIAMGVIAGQAANQGQVYRYPVNARYF
jgi:uncharacterized Tic20 family protein